MAISYSDAPTNLSDSETNHVGSMSILAKFMMTGKFPLSFTARNSTVEMKNGAPVEKIDHESNEN